MVVCTHLRPFWLLGLACPRSGSCGLAHAHLGLFWLAWARVGLVLTGERQVRGVVGERWL
jgi:hypothetical protein